MSCQIDLFTIHFINTTTINFLWKEKIDRDAEANPINFCETFSTQTMRTIRFAEFE